MFGFTKCPCVLVSSNEVELASAFNWMKGYDNCRTGWDRFEKPRPFASALMGNVQQKQEEGGVKEGFPGKRYVIIFGVHSMRQDSHHIIYIYCTAQ